MCGTETHTAHRTWHAVHGLVQLVERGKQSRIRGVARNSLGEVMSQYAVRIFVWDWWFASADLTFEKRSGERDTPGVFHARRAQNPIRTVQQKLFAKQRQSVVLELPRLSFPSPFRGGQLVQHRSTI